MKRPTEAWFAARSLAESRAWLKASENYERCGFGTPKLRYIAKRMRQRIADLEALEGQALALTSEHPQFGPSNPQ